MLICGILYELLISTLSSYFQGNSVLHFSLVIGLFLSFMGVGSYFSRFIKKDLLAWFIRFELLLGILGGCSTLILYASFSLTPYYYGVVFGLIGILGACIGIEIPILTRMVREYEELRNALAHVLSFDYLGALIASVAFPLILLPTLGTMRTAFLVGLLNLAVALINIRMFRRELKAARDWLMVTGLFMAMLAVGFLYSFQLVGFFDQFLYRDEIRLTRQTPYQHLVVTHWNDDTRLFINGNLQFSSKDEYRYHEVLVHLPMGSALSHEQVLILGGGDGLAVREILKYPDVKGITLVDLDPEMTKLGRDHPLFTKLNNGAMQDPRVQIVNQDAYKFVEETKQSFDVVLIDLPDPHEASLGKLYSVEFYRILEKCLSARGVVITQATSPYFAPEAFWCIHRTMEEVFPQVLACQAYVPSFGPWGFQLAYAQAPRSDSLRVSDSLMQERLIQQISQEWLFQNAQDTLQYLTPELLPALFVFDKESQEQEVDPNRLENQRLITYYTESFDRWR